jgi:hypothetical protein
MLNRFLPNAPTSTNTPKINLPDVFGKFWSNFAFLSLDLSLVPMNCIVDSDFHDRLVATTVAPILIVLGIAVVWLLLKQRLRLVGGDDYKASLATLTAKSIRLSVIFLFTVFPSKTPLLSLLSHATLPIRVNVPWK